MGAVDEDESTGVAAEFYDIEEWKDQRTAGRDVIDDGKPRSSEADADAYVEALKDEAATLGGGPVTTVVGVPGATVTP